MDDLMGNRSRMHEQREMASARRAHEVAEVVLVTGPACSGKSTYVAERSSRGDLTIDFDAIAAALGSPESHDHPDSLIPFVLDARSAVIARIHRHPGQRVFLIAAYPTAQDLAMASEVVELAVPADECKRRARAAGRPAGWDSFIDQWWLARGI